jgi:hypothetical protein
MGEISNAYKILVRESKGRDPIGSPRHRYKANITIDLKGIRCKCVDWIHLAQDKDQLKVNVNML